MASNSSFIGKFSPLLLSVLYAFILVSLLLVSPAAAEINDENYIYSPWSAGLGAGVLFFEADEEFNSSLIIESKIGRDLNEKFTLEGSLGYLPYMKSRSGTSQDSRTWHLDTSQGFRSAADLLYHLNSSDNRKWDPTVGVTAGVMYFSNTLEDGDHFDPFAGLGAGLGRALNRNWVARGDYRLVVAGHDTEINHHVLVSLMYRFGGVPGSDGSGSGDFDSASKPNSNLRPVYFDFDQSALSPIAQETLKENAEYLNAEPKVSVTVEGHCDERGTEEYNMALGERRAEAAKEYLRALGVDGERMDTISYGEAQPADSGHNEDAWKLNRRAECVPAKQ